MNSDRFSYQKGDIEIKKTQCNFCKYNQEDDNNQEIACCAKYPDGKPDDIVRTIRRCPFLEY